MPGYLESLMNPGTMGLLNLGAGLLQASGPSPYPVSTGAALGKGLQQGVQGMFNAQKMQQLQTLTDLEKQKLAQAKAQFDLQQNVLRGLLPQFGVTGTAPTAAAGGTAPTSPVITNPQANPRYGLPQPTGGAQPSTFPFDLNQVTALKLAGLPDLTSAYTASRPDITTVDKGNEIWILDKHNPDNVLQKIPKGAAPGAVPYEAGDIPPGDYRNFLLDRARASASQVNNNIKNFTPASEAAQKDFMDKTSKNYDALRTAPVMVQNIAKAKALAASGNPFIGSFGTQKAAVAQFFNNNLGTSIAPDQIASAGELQNRLFQGIMDNLKKMDAQPSEMQQRLMMDALGNLNTDPNALQKILGVTEEIIRGKVALHNKEVQSGIDRGVKFPYDPIIQMPGKEDGGGAPKSFPTPSSAAVNRLKMNPAERGKFEAVFGPGSAAKYLGR